MAVVRDIPAEGVGEIWIMMQAHVFISGFVQGVAFRQFVKSSALKLGVSGWVKNLPDNRVEAVFQGDEKAVEQLVVLCKKGPFLSEVKDVITSWEKSEKTHAEFSIIR